MSGSVAAWAAGLAVVLLRTRRRMHAAQRGYLDVLRGSIDGVPGGDEPIPVEWLYEPLDLDDRGGR